MRSSDFGREGDRGEKRKRAGQGNSPSVNWFTHGSALRVNVFGGDEIR